MRIITLVLGLPMLLSVTAFPVRAQADEQAVLATVRQLFTGMRTRDSTAMNQVFVPEARLVATAVRNGQTVVSMIPAARFVAQVAAATGPAWNETIQDPEIRVDGDLATVWAYYEFHLGDRFSHCGIDAFQLARTAAGWRITQVADTRRTTGCRSQEG